MTIKERAQNYWKTKSVFAKISDLLFIILILALIHPTSRIEVISFVKRVTAFSPNEIAKEDRKAISKQDYNWVFETMDGKEINMQEYIGKSVFLNQWATWCPPCVAEMPSIQKLYDKVKDNENVKFVIITNEKRETVKAFMQKRGFSFPVVLARSKTPEVFKSESIPVSFVISPKGEILIKEYGSKKWHSEETVQILTGK